MEMFSEQSLGVKTIVNVYPEKQWKLSSLHTICRRIDKTQSLVDTRVDSGRPKSARLAETETLKTRN